MSITDTIKNISRDEENWLKDFREQNLKIFESLPWERTKYTSLKLNAEELNISGKLNGFKINVPDDVVFLDIFDALEKYPHLKQYFTTEQNKIASMQNALFNAGFFLYVPKNMDVTIPMKVLFDEEKFARNIIIVDENSKLNLVQSINGSSNIASILLDVHLKQNAQMQYSTIQDMGQETTGIINQTAHLDRDSRFNWTTGTLGGKIIKGRREIILQGEGAEANDLEIIFGNNNQQFELNTNIYHKVPHTKGHSTTKGVLDDSARAMTQGLAKIEKAANGSDSYLAEHILLINPKAKAEPMPFMEIDTNDVKAKHSSFVSQIDEEKVFYLRSRGLDENESRKIVVLGFLETSMQQADAIREDLRQLIEKKWKD